ncbi:hypothetical protein DFJ73DRAFT_773858 [Zopfochytrium polystomum]|nr:hypothetical protein DFJ73DRAFT_773858 [Zopfochytrium polystomum]
MRRDRINVEIIKGAIETLKTLFTRQPTADFYQTERPSSPSAAADPLDLGVILTEIFLKVVPRGPLFFVTLKQWKDKPLS